VDVADMAGMPRTSAAGTARSTPVEAGTILPGSEAAPATSGGTDRAPGLPLGRSRDRTLSARRYAAILRGSESDPG